MIQFIFILAQMLTAKDNPVCAECEANEGTCYSKDGGATDVGCQCDVSRSGPDCSTVNGK